VVSLLGAEDVHEAMRHRREFTGLSVRLQSGGELFVRLHTQRLFHLTTSSQLRLTHYWLGRGLVVTHCVQSTKLLYAELG